MSSYFKMVKLFQLEGKVASIMSGTKGFLYYCNCFPSVFVDRCWVSCLTLTFVVQGVLCAVDLALDSMGFRLSNIASSHESEIVNPLPKG